MLWVFWDAIRLLEIDPIPTPTIDMALLPSAAGHQAIPNIRRRGSRRRGGPRYICINTWYMLSTVVTTLADA